VLPPSAGECVGDFAIGAEPQGTFLNAGPGECRPPEFRGSAGL